jgi:hypothetical protein
MTEKVGKRQIVSLLTWHPSEVLLHIRASKTLKLTGYYYEIPVVQAIARHGENTIQLLHGNHRRVQLTDGALREIEHALQRFKETGRPYRDGKRAARNRRGK